MELSDLPQPVKVTDWVIANPSNEIGNNQAMFVRDSIHPLLARYEERREYPVRVVSQHRSKSVPLPVYAIKVPTKGLEIIARCNFYDWKVTVLSKVPVGDIFDKLLVKPEEDVKLIYCEGFIKEWLRRAFIPPVNNREFTVELPGSPMNPEFTKGMFFTFCFLLGRDLVGE